MHCCLKPSFFGSSGKLPLYISHNDFHIREEIHLSKLMSLFANLLKTQILVAEYHIQFTFINCEFSRGTNGTAKVEAYIYSGTKPEVLPLFSSI